MRRQNGYSLYIMAEVILKNLKKVYPNAESKKTKKGEPQKKGNLQITDEGVVAVQDFNLHIADKEFIVLVGPSGCGKSTTLRMIAGLEDISGGELTIGGKLMNDVEPKDRDIAMVFQSYALYPHMTVYENMAFSLKLKKLPKDEIDKKVREAAEILDITQYLDRKPKALSGGQRQRVAIGRAIVRDPAVFLMDEPLSNLDAKLRNQMRAEIIKLRERIDTTFIYVTHDQTEAMTLGDRIVIMRDGWIMQIGTPRDIYAKPQNPFVAGFIGVSNFLDCEVNAPAPGNAAVSIKGELDMAAIPANLAATLYQKTSGGIQAVAVNTLGVLYVVEQGDTVHSMADLKGRTILSTGKGTTPEYVLRYLLTANGLDPDKDVDIQYYSEATEVTAQMASTQDAIAVLPQPYVTAAGLKDDTLRVALDLTAEWDKVADTQLITGVTVVRKAYAEEHPDVVAAFLADYAQSVNAANTDLDGTAALCEEQGVVAKAAIAKKALPNCNIVCLTGEELKADVSGYLQVLYDADPAAVGGALPGEDFYWTAQ